MHTLTLTCTLARHYDRRVAPRIGLHPHPLHPVQLLHRLPPPAGALARQQHAVAHHLVGPQPVPRAHLLAQQHHLGTRQRARQHSDSERDVQGRKLVGWNSRTHELTVIRYDS